MKPTSVKQKAINIVAKLKEVYPEALCSLEWHGEDWKLLIMGALSAQCTDERVNIVCEDLFAKYHSPKEIAEANLTEIEEIIKSCGLYHNKAKNMMLACQRLVEVYDSKVPDNMDDLLTLAGVGRKVGNLLLGDIHHKGGVVTDTHCIRICGRLGFYPESEKNPVKVEKILTPLIPVEEQSNFCHRLVLFGRETCSAKNPSCANCPINPYCKHYKGD